MSKRMGTVKLVSALCLSLILALCPCGKASAVAVPMPILPYIPPETGQVLDYLLNANGVTAPAIEGEQNKLDAYLDLYKRALGAGWETAWNETLETIEKGKLAGKMEMSSGVVSALGSAMSYGLQNGVAVGEETEPINTLVDGASWLTENMKASVGEGELLANAVGNGAVSSDVAYNIYAWYEYNPSGRHYEYIVCTPISRTISMSGGTLTSSWGGAVLLLVKGIDGTEYNSSNRVNSPFTVALWDNGTFVSLSNLGTETTPIVAQTAEIGQAVTAGTIRALSAYTALNADGTIDTTKPLVVPMPLVDVVPATTVDDLARVQDAQGVAPAVVGEDVSSIVQGLQTAQSDVMDYNLTLANYFPFCIPFDLGNLASRFVADPVAPFFEWTFRNVDGSDIVKEISLEWLNPVMEVVRAGELLLAGIGLALLTPSLIKW